MFSSYDGMQMWMPWTLTAPAKLSDTSWHAFRAWHLAAGSSNNTKLPSTDIRYAQRMDQRIRCR